MIITNLEIAQATVEMFGAVVCAMCIYIIFWIGRKSKSLNLFKGMFLAAALDFAAEACAYIFRGNVDDLSIAINGIGNLLVFILNFVLIALFVRYVYSTIGEKGVMPHRGFIIASDIVCALALILVISNQFTCWMYYFDENNYYHRNTLWYLYIGLSLVGIAIGGLMTIVYRKRISRAIISSIQVYVFIPVLAIIVQTFFYGFSIINIAIAIGLVLMLFVYLKEWSKSSDKEAEMKQRKASEIIILFVIMVISMSASMASCIISLGRISTTNAKSDNQIIAHMVHDSIESEFLKPLTVAQTMSEDYSLKKLLDKGRRFGAESIHDELGSYLAAIRDGFGFQMVYAVEEKSRAYITYNGIDKYLDIDNDPHDIWYKDKLEHEDKYLLNVDTDEVNGWALAVYVNMDVFDLWGERLGVCGVAKEMSALQELIKGFEERYGIEIYLINRDGLIQVASDGAKIEAEYLDVPYLDQVTDEEFYYLQEEGQVTLARYLEDLDWYLVIDAGANHMYDALEVTLPSIIIFIVGLVMMGLAFAIITINERKTAAELVETKTETLTDELTGLLNRRAFDEHCDKIQKENQVSEFVIVALDVNGLKTVNDTIGHSAGDELLIGASVCILRAFVQFGNVYRTGGDEFMALLNCDRETAEAAMVEFDEICAKWKGKTIKSLTIAKGFVVCSEHGDKSFDELKELADKYMYVDKVNYYKQTGQDRRKYPDIR